MPEQTIVHERLNVPLSWWLLALGFAATIVVAVGAYLGTAWAIGVALASLLLVALWLVGYGSTAVRVDAQGLHAGRSLLDWPHLACAEELDADAMHRALGTGANAADHYLTRSYIRGGVRVTLDDPADPHPHWIISSRRPAELVAAVDAHLAQQVEASR